MLPRRGSHGWKVIARTMIVRRPALQLPIELSTRQGSLWPNRSARCRVAQLYRRLQTPGGDARHCSMQKYWKAPACFRAAQDYWLKREEGFALGRSVGRPATCRMSNRRALWWPRELHTGAVQAPSSMPCVTRKENLKTYRRTNAHTARTSSAVARQNAPRRNDLAHFPVTVDRRSHGLSRRRGART